MSDARPATSRIKPRMIPSIGTSSSTNASRHESEVIPPTPISIIQVIAVNRCAVPAEEVTEALLLAQATIAPTTNAGPPPPEDHVGAPASPAA